jgi:uncharacterized protein (TIGR02453 family)
MDQRFSGFTPATLEFLQNLAANNSKAWFEAHRAEYEQHLLAPMKALVGELAGPLLALDPELVTTPTRAISRIYRDIRFSRDKSPYKTTLWITLKRPLKEWQDAPCFFFELAPDSYRFGMGFYSAAKGTMDRLRERIERRPAEFKKAIAFYAGQDQFVLEGERYKRPLRTDLPDSLQEWHGRKNLYLVCNRQPDASLFTRGVAEELRRGFTMLAPFYDYLWQVKLAANKYVRTS